METSNTIKKLCAFRKQEQFLYYLGEVIKKKKTKGLYLDGGFKKKLDIKVEFGNIQQAWK